MVEVALIGTGEMFMACQDELISITSPDFLMDLGGDEDAPKRPVDDDFFDDDDDDFDDDDEFDNDDEFEDDFLDDDDDFLDDEEDETL